MAEVDQAILKHALSAPNSISQNLGRLTYYLVKPYRNKYDKLKVIAYWMATHIAYDYYRYDNDTYYEQTNRYKYDILKVKTGVCSDFALLFKEMATYAGIKDVSYVSGKVYDTDVLKKKYNQETDGHAWNEAVIDGRHFYIDTTWMSHLGIGRDRKKKSRKSPLEHKKELNERKRNKIKISENIDDFYFDFSPQKEVLKRKKHHWVKDQNLNSFRPRGKKNASRQKTKMPTTVKNKSPAKQQKTVYHLPDKKEFSQKTIRRQGRTTQGKRKQFAENRSLARENNNMARRMSFLKQQYLKSHQKPEEGINKKTLPYRKETLQPKTLPQKINHSTENIGSLASESLPSLATTQIEKKTSSTRNNIVSKKKETASPVKKRISQATKERKENKKTITSEIMDVLQEKFHQAKDFLKKQFEAIMTLILKNFGKT